MIKNPVIKPVWFLSVLLLSASCLLFSIPFHLLSVISSIFSFRLDGQKNGPGSSLLSKFFSFLFQDKSSILLFSSFSSFPSPPFFPYLPPTPHPSVSFFTFPWPPGFCIRSYRRQIPGSPLLKSMSPSLDLRGGRMEHHYWWTCMAGPMCRRCHQRFPDRQLYENPTGWRRVLERYIWQMSTSHLECSAFSVR